MNDSWIRADDARPGMIIVADMSGPMKPFEIKRIEREDSRVHLINAAKWSYEFSQDEMIKVT